MQRSTERIRTTHVGSLPRSDKLTRLMYASQEDHADRPEMDVRVYVDRF